MSVTDLAYHIRAGQLMLDTGTILRHDVFTWTIADRPWTDQQWGAQIVLASFYRAAGWRGLVLVRALLVCVCIGATYERTRSAIRDSSVAGGLTLVAFSCSAAVPGVLAMRPQLLAAPLFLVTAWTLDHRHDRPHLLIALPLVAAGWANVHGSFVLLPMMVTIALVADLLARRREAWRTTTTLLVAVGATFATPWGVDAYRYVIDVATSPVVRDVVDEWLPLWHHMPGGLAFLGATVALGWAIARKGRRPSFEEVATIVVFTALAAWSGRNLVWWALAVPPVAGSLLRGWSPASGFPRRIVVACGVAMAALVALAGVRVLAVDPSTDLLAQAPARVSAELERASRSDGHVLNTSFGSWLELTAPSVPVFIDARVELFPDAIWADYFHVRDAEPGWQAVLDRLEVDVVVLDRARDVVLDEALRMEAGWRLLVEDAEGRVYVRTGTGSSTSELATDP